MNQRCVIYYEKRLNGNRATSEINTEQRVESLEDGGRIQNMKLVLSPSFSSFANTAFLRKKNIKPYRPVLMLKE